MQKETPQETENTAMAPFDPHDLAPVESDLNHTDLIFCSVPHETREQKLALYNMISGNSESIADLADSGGQIDIRDVIGIAMDFTNEETGEISRATRIILVDDKGVSYGCVSNGIVGSIKKLVAIMGPPPWIPSISVRPLRIPTAKDRTRKTLILKAL